MGIASTVGRLVVGALANWNMEFLLHYYAICIILFGLGNYLVLKNISLKFLTVEIFFQYHHYHYFTINFGY